MLLLAAAVFIGNQACRPCHAAIADAYATTAMARSSGRVASIPPAVFIAAGHRYRIADNRLLFEMGFETGSVPFDYFIGSNAAGRSFLFARDNYLFELPVTWYSQKRKWDASPGYEREKAIRLNRPVEPSCLECHASRVRPVFQTQNRYGDPPFLENGVGCERCHGPGSEHVRDPAKARMVNPAKLEPERRDSICSQCHLTGEARIERPGRSMAEFRAGDRVADYATYFVWKLGRRDLKVTSHVEKLAASACKRVSGDALWCGTCHDPHTNADKTQAACLSCHADAHRGDDRAESRCASCHMPKSQAVDANHGVLTDHSIPRVPQPSVPPTPGDLVVFAGTADDRAFGLAYYEVGDVRAREYLLRAKPADLPVRLRLAALEKDSRRAVALYESVLRENPGQTVALVNLGSLYAANGRVVEAGRLWERALATNPAIEEAVLNLAKIRPAAEAKSIIKRYLDVNPASAEARSRCLTCGAHK
ncbi:MAG: hypothetical protein M3Y07_13660 [Acidobacteriota bacterium]|nr:hypothetical protein [Acidobacteriota bacterium]